MKANLFLKWILIGFALGAMIQGANAATLVLNPGDGKQYLANWCGGQKIDEIAEGFNVDATISTIVKVQTTCSTGGRGSVPKTFMACWRVTFSRDGAIVNQEFLNSGSWRRGSPSVQCAASYDVDAFFVDIDGANLYTVLIPLINHPYQSTYSDGYRAVLETP